MGARRRQFTPMRNIASAVVLIGFLLAAAWLAAQLEPVEAAVTARARASDGDSLQLAGDRVRLLGIDAPELAQLCVDARGRNWPCGREARDAMSALLRRGDLTCQPDGRDRYNRMLAHCRIGKDDIAAIMVRDGWAVATEDYFAEEQAARRARRGIWQGGFELPRDWRRDQDAQRRDDGPLDALMRLLRG